MKRELRCKSETIPVAVSLLTLGAFLMATASVSGKVALSKTSQKTCLCLILGCFRVIERQDRVCWAMRVAVSTPPASVCDEKYLKVNYI